MMISDNLDEIAVRSTFDTTYDLLVRHACYTIEN